MFVKNYFLFLYLLCFIKLCTSAGLPLSVYEKAKFKKALETQGLYDDAEDVLYLTATNFKPVIYGKQHSTLVEFYNSYCGFCRRYAPAWKTFATEVADWSETVRVGAIDCATEENGDICREFEIMGYPTLRYFSPEYEDGDKKFGTDFERLEGDELRHRLIKVLTEETNKTDKWPKLEPIKDSELAELFYQLTDLTKYVFVINASKDSNIPSEVILDLHSSKNILVRKTIAKATGSTISIIAIDRANSIVPVKIEEITRIGIYRAIREFLREKSIFLTKATTQTSLILTSSISTETSIQLYKLPENISTDLKTLEGRSFQADLEQAVKFSIFHEIPRHSKINGDKLIALQKFLEIISKYAPLGDNGLKFLKELRDYVLNVNTDLDGANFLVKANEVEAKYKPVFSSRNWISCHSDIKGLRRFPCSLWMLFHFLTVQSAENEKATDPLEVLHAVFGYIKGFFGCTECSNHFQEMAKRNKIWNVTSKDNAVLWLWAAHNEVNTRLAGDITEDPKHPKIMYPSIDMCQECRKETSTNKVIDWDKTEVLMYMKRVHSMENVSRLGVDDETVLPASLEQFRAKRLLGSVFSDVDMRMGIFLYVFCVGMMIVAVKLFLRRGYRKKMYVHDMLGKV